MKTIIIPLVAFGLGLGCLHTDISHAQETAGRERQVAAAATATEAEQKFIARASSGGVAEVQLGELAKDRSSRPEVKEFAAMMVKDHSKANSELITIAAGMGVAPTKDLQKDHQDAVAKLSKAEAKDTFDKDYAKLMVKDHKKTIAEFEAASKEVKNPALKAFVDKTLPTLNLHLTHAKTLEDKVK
jgi:putative membrane protein